ncbi:MAG: hypothetical protein WD734_04870 [Dehalococcoidia bacterium]
MRELLERYNPTLVIYPQDASRDRPGAFRPRAGWGDYHPCTAEFFIDRAVRRDCPESYDFLAGVLSRVRGDSSTPLERDRVQAARGFLAVSRPEQSARWELDICEIPSQDPKRAWPAYAAFLDSTDPEDVPHRCVAYSRVVEGPGGRLLQYWYLYAYNDFLNQHEGDWEMVTIALDGADQPVEVAYSNHHGGVRRAWEDTPRAGDSPLVYVSRGSHAGYFRFASGGHPLVGELSAGRVPRAFFFLIPLRHAANFVIRYVQRIPGIRLFRDNPPADPVRDTDAPQEKVGVRVTPEVAVLPDEDGQTVDSDFWWMRFRGYWGSTRPRVSGSVGVVGPWASTSTLDLRWRDPRGWMECCKLEQRSMVEVAGRIAAGALRRGRAVRPGGRR